MPQLIFYLEQDYPQVQDLLDAKLSIGRTKDNDVALRDSRVSVFHAEIARKADGAFLLTDLGSHNGTLVNGKPVEETVLEDGDEIKFGSVKALFVDLRESTDLAPEKSALEMEAAGLMRKSEIERNNLKLIEADCKRVRGVIDEAHHQKGELEAELNRLSSDIDKGKVDLDGKTRESNEISAAIKDAKAFEKNVVELEAKQKKRESAYQDLGKKISEREKALADLDLVGATKQRDELDADHGRLSKQIEIAKTDLDKRRLESEEAAVIFKKAKVIEAGIEEQKAKMAGLKKDNEELEKEIGERENASSVLIKKIDDQNQLLKSLGESAGNKQKEVENLTNQLGKNEDLIRASNEKISVVEGALLKGRDELSRSQVAQKSLLKESGTLSLLVSEKSSVLQRIKEKIISKQYGTDHDDGCPPLRVINPAMRSLVHYFHSGAGIPDQERVDPIGFYGLAACTRGSMHRDADSILTGDDPVFVLLSGDLDKDRELIESISRERPGKILLVGWSHGKLEALASGKDFGSQLVKLLGGVSGIISFDSATSKVLDEFDIGLPHINVQMPCPIEFPEWNLSDSNSKENSGVFVSGDGFDVGSQLHRFRLELLNKLATETKTRFTLFQQEMADIPGLKIPGDRLTISSGPVRYSEYLRLMCKHRLVTGFGPNLAGGNIKGDSVLARTVFVGADGGNAVDELLFPDTCIIDGDIDRVLKASTRLLSDRGAFVESRDRIQNLAPQLMSFESVSDRIKDFIHFISANPDGV